MDLPKSEKRSKAAKDCWRDLAPPGSKARADKQKGLKRGNETKGLRDQAKAQEEILADLDG